MTFTCIYFNDYKPVRAHVINLCPYTMPSSNQLFFRYTMSADEQSKVDSEIEISAYNN